MITHDNGTFVLSTENLDYIMRVVPTGQLEHLYLGDRLRKEDIPALPSHQEAGVGTATEYERNGHKVFLDMLPMEYSGIGKGDFRLTPLEVKMPDGTFVTDFVYLSHRITDGIRPPEGLPHGRSGEGVRSLEIVMKDTLFDLELVLVYTVYPKADAITRRTVLRNNSEKPVEIRKIMSMMMDLHGKDYDLISLHGGWIKEANVTRQPLFRGTYVIDSVTGNSSNRHNPGIILARKHTSEDHGACIGVNLIYSGNHYEAVQVSNHGLTRVMTGINPHAFSWPLGPGETFETPEAVITYASSGLNGLSERFHTFIHGHIIDPAFKDKERPVVMNTWEAFFMDINARKLKAFARKAAGFGIETVVLDDGWFGKRNDDTKGLGDYDVNRKKFPKGLSGSLESIRKQGLTFGIWVEPEMVNPDSDYYRQSPDDAIKVEGRTPVLGRNQLVLDLCKPSVRDRIVEKIDSLLSEHDITYVKWDMNRHITDMMSPGLKDQGMFFHSYILGLHDVLTRIRTRHPDVLFESCASGGNRFDLGMLYHTPQIWASDNTDPISRLSIQEGLSYFYPMSTVGSHVSLSPHAQTVRTTPLWTRFNVAAFGVLGYELDPAFLSHREKKEIQKQVAFYKTHRKTFQFGTFRRFDRDESHRIRFQAGDASTSVVGDFQTLAKPSPDVENLHVKNLDPDALYDVRSLDQSFSIKRLGHLVSHVLPIRLKPEGALFQILSRYVGVDRNKERFTASGTHLMHGLKLTPQFMGTDKNDATRVMGDHGSTLYVATRLANDGA